MIAEPLSREAGLFQSHIQEGVQSVLDNGYYVIENSLSPELCAETVQLLDGMIERGEMHEHGGAGGFGYHLSPLAPHHAHFCDILCCPIALGIAAGVLEDEPVLKVHGTRVSQTGMHVARLGWHAHRYTPEENTYQHGAQQRGTRPRRLVCGWYMEGCNAASGPLVVLPRRYDDVLAPPSQAYDGEWPGEIHVSCPPGSAVIFSTDLWHAALSGTSEERRHLVGVHFQARSITRPHMEDEVFAGSIIDEAAAGNPVFARLSRER